MACRGSAASRRGKRFRSCDDLKIRFSSLLIQVETTHRASKRACQGSDISDPRTRSSLKIWLQAHRFTKKFVGCRRSAENRRSR